MMFVLVIIYRPLPAVTNQVRVNMKEAGLYDKFPAHTTLLADFRKYLTESLLVPDCREEVRSL